MNRSIKPLASIGCFLTLASCSPFIASSPSPVTTIPTTEEVVEYNPHPVGSYEHFKHSDYPRKRTSYQNIGILEKTNPSNSSLVIFLGKQRAYLMNGRDIAMDYPVSTGKPGHKTPAGSYHIMEKIVSKRSNLYGRVFNAAGTVVNSDATAGVSKIPAGGKFVGASMPYWMRFTSGGIGHHVGRVPRYAASHGCIRGQWGAIPTVFHKVKVGTRVRIVE